MENKLELKNQNLSLFLPGENKLNKERGLSFARAVVKMSLAKNIKLAEGTIAVWEECLLEDIESGVMDFEDFIEATKKVIREPLFNRIDYSDIYTLAISICSRRKMKEPFENPKHGSPMPNDLKSILQEIGIKK